MVKIRTRKSKVVMFCSIVAVSVGVLFFLLRGPYLSNSIKRIIIPVLENVTRERVIIDKAVINLFPFYIQAKGLKIFDNDGNRLLWVTKTRAYIDILSLLSNEIKIRKLTLKEPDLTASEKDLERTTKNVSKQSSTVNKQSSPERKDKYSVTLRNLKITDGNFKYRDALAENTVSGTGLFASMVNKRNGTFVDVLLKEGTIVLANGAALNIGFEAKANINGSEVELSSLEIKSSKSTLSLKGKMLVADSKAIDKGSFTGKVELNADTINKIFALESNKEGRLTFEGSVKLSKSRNARWPEFTLNLKTKSRFYLDTLMEIVKVEDNVKGEIYLDGTITGTFQGLTGRGTAKLEKAVFDTLPIDNTIGEITYKNNKFTLHNFKARTYGGELEGDAYILVPRGDYYVTGSIEDVRSPEFFNFINWQPPFPEGRISGSVQLSHEPGHDIEVVADVAYLNTTRDGDDLLNRLDTVSAVIDLRDNNLRLENAIMSTSKSDLMLYGDINLNDEYMDLNILLESPDVSDLTYPEYSDFKAPVRFNGRAAGSTADPLIHGSLQAQGGTIHGMAFDSASADIEYRIKSLKFSELRINQGNATYDASGLIKFRKSRDLFTFKDPWFKAKAVLGSVNFAPFIKASYKEIPISGLAGGELEFEGDYRDYEAKGNLVIADAEVYGQELEKITVNTILKPDIIKFDSITAAGGESEVNASGTLAFDKKYEVFMSSKKIRLADIQLLNAGDLNAIFDFELNGRGTLENPEAELSINVIEGSYKNIPTGKGSINGRLKGKDVKADGSFYDGMITAGATAVLDEKPEWNIDVDFKRGNYDFLLTVMLADPPRDLSASIEGAMTVTGRGNEISMLSNFNYFELSMYSYHFRNRENIELKLQDNRFTVKSFALTGNNAEFFAAGFVNINKSYEIALRGKMDIAPLKALSESITSLRGQSNFHINVEGPWERPELLGEISLRDVTASLPDFSYKIGPIYGSIFLKKDRITFDNLNAGFAGGNILISGVGYINKLSLSRLYVSSEISGIRIRPIEGISVDLNGKLFYETAPESSSITGDIDIEKAKYEKRVEWKSWLLGLKEIKEEKVNYPSFLKETQLNIRVNSDNILIDNNIARAPVKMSINVIGKPGEIGLVGRMQADRGNIYFRGNEFNLLEGSSVDFIESSRIEPLFHILSDTYVNNYYVRLSLDGTINKFSLNLFSDPPLAEPEILSLLTFGQLDKEEGGIESDMAAGEAMALLTGTLQDKVEEEFKDITGFERFEIEPHTTTAGAFTPKVTLGKRLLEDKVFVTYSGTVGTIEEQAIKVEYKLNENLSVVGSRNEIGSAGLDFKYRIEFK
jgi:translocation and assembly module TamB